MNNKLIQTICLIIVLLCGYSEAGAQVSGVEAVTLPSKDVTIAFLRAGQIARMPVIIGAKVKAGQIVAELDDSVEQMQVERLKLKSKDMTLINARQAALDQSKVELELIEEGYKKEVSTKLEVDRAVLQVTTAKAELDLAKFNLRLAKLEYKEIQAQIAQMKLKSPADGTVEAIMIDEGETTNMQMEPVMQIVQINPLWINARVPLLQGKKLKPGGVAMVDFGYGEKETRKGKIVHVASVADVGSDTMIVRVEVPNPSMRISGEMVRVRFSDKISGRDDGVKSRPNKSKSGSGKGHKEKK